ncbi:MAG: hypothetical protein JW737_04240 [Acidobacteria bacterium]|nr:hypothetical protein [Acidobacteriota bacterium]
MKLKSVLLWILAVILTLGISVYQRITGPTNPVRGTETFMDSEISYKLLRSYTKFENLPVEIKADNKDITAELHYRRYKADENWTIIEMVREGDSLKSSIPGMDSAAKVEYIVKVKSDENSLILHNGVAAVARFKGKVPIFLLIPHIIFMFLGMIFGLRTGFEALRKDGKHKKLLLTTIIITGIGGFILGPIVQKLAFGSLWTGFPFGYDLTDNKVLLIMIFLVLAYFMSRKSRWWVVAAVVLMVIVYLIPHSVLGSELDPKTGKMKNVFAIRAVIR